MSVTSLLSLFDKASDVDPDLRFMALNDLNKFLIAQSSGLTPRNVDSITKILFDRLDDSNSDVQNQAVKCFSPLTKAASASKIVSILSKLCSLANTNSITTSISTMALRSALQNLVVSQSTARDIISSLLPKVQTSYLDSIEILTDLIRYLGVAFKDNEVYQESIYLTDLAFNSEGIISKRAVIALGLLFRYATDQQISDIIGYVSTRCNTKVSEKSILSPHSIRLSIFSTLLNVSPSKVESIVPVIFGVISQNLFLDKIEEEPDYDQNVKYNEVRDDALLCLDNLIPIGYDLISPYLDTILEQIKIFLVYDPFNDEETEYLDADDDGDDVDDVVFSDDDEVYDDDNSDDMSWRLRKQAAKIINTLVCNYPVILSTVYGSLGDALTMKMNDRVESVADEVISTLTVLVEGAAKDGPYYQYKHITDLTRRGSDASMQLENDPYSVLTYLYPILIENFTTQLAKIKSLTRFKLILMLATSLSNVNNGIDDNLERLLVGIKGFRNQTNFNITIELLKFYSAIFRTNSLDALGSQLQFVVDDILECIKSSLNNIISESLSTATDLFEASSNGQRGNLLDLAGSILERAVNRTFSSDIRRKSIFSLSELVYNVEISDTEFLNILKLLHESLNYESIAESSIISIGKIASEGCKNQTFPQEWVDSIIVQLSAFIGSSESALQTSALETLAILGGNPNVQANNEDSDEIITNIIKFTSYTDRIQLSLALNVLSKFIYSASINESKINEISVVFSKSSKLEEMDYGPLVSIVKQLVRKTTPEILYGVIKGTSNNNNNPVVSKLLATVVVEANLDGKISASEEELQNNINVLYNIQFLGHISEAKELNLDVGVFSSYFDSSDETIRIEAARSIGNMISRDINVYLPPLLEQLVINKAHRYLLLTAIKQDLDVKIVSSGTEPAKVSESNSNEIWNTIFQTQSLESDLDETECNVAGACLSLIALTYPSKILEFVGILDSSPSLSISYTIIVAIKHLVSYSETFAIDLYLSRVLVPVLSLISISNIRIKQGLISTLVTALHSKPNLILASLNEILPRVYEELDPRKEFIKSIQMGPFKHKIDEGIEIRKVAFELLYSIVSLENKSYTINYYELLNMTINKGMKDDHEIVVLSCVIISSVIKFLPELLCKNDIFDNFIEKSNLILNKKLKDSAPKQQVEKQEEAIKSIIKSSKKINEVINSDGDMIGISAVELSRWNEYIHSLRSNFNYDVRD